ncbi:MAG: hypothetical protein AB1696_23470 [Planctomycetota bacterium]
MRRPTTYCGGESVAGRIFAFDRVTSPPPDIYCDSSFILDVLYTDRPSLDFYILGVDSKTTFWTSWLAVEELTYVAFKGGIARSKEYKAVEKERKAQGKTLDPKRFAREFPAEYQKVAGKARSNASKMYTSIANLHVDIRAIDQAHLAGVCRFAAKIFGEHDLESADAFHIAIALAGGTTNMASNDGHFRAGLDMVDVYTSRP